MGIRNLIDRSRETLRDALSRLAPADSARSATLRPALDLAQLEDRIMLSASPIGDLLMPVDGTPEAASDLVADSSPPPAADQASPTAADPTAWKVETQVELVFVDQGVQDYEQLVVDLLRDADPVRHFEVVLLDENRNGIDQISEVLQGYTDLSAIHFVSHGTAGRINLGDLWLSDLNIDAYAGKIAAWNDSLRDGADLLIYGCDLASTAAGRTLVESLGALCDCDVAASDDDTGNARYGGDWELEFATGSLETAVAFSTELQQNWDGLLAAITVDTFNDFSDGGDTSTIASLIATPGTDGISLREAIIATNNESAQADDIFLFSAGTYTLALGLPGEDLSAGGDLDIRDAVTIHGIDAATTIIDGNSLDRVFHVLTAAGDLTLSDVSVQGGNAVAANGGAFLVDPTSTLTLTNTIISNNQSFRGAGIYNAGTISLTDVELANNGTIVGTWEGAGIYDAGDTTLNRVTINGNQSEYGGGIFVDGTSTSLLITNSTISGNTVGSSGGGGTFNQSATIVNSTITLNSGGAAGGFFKTGGGHTVELKNTIVAGNTGSKPNLQGAFVSQGNNLIGEDDGFTGIVDGVNGDQVGTTAAPLDPLLGALAANGGFTKTHALLVGSSAIDAGTTVGAPAVDQRNVGRNATPDIGAFEVSVATGTLWFTTLGNGAATGETWTDAEIVQFGDAGDTFDLDTGTTSGTFAKLTGFVAPADIRGMHYVEANITIGTNPNHFDLSSGDLLLTLDPGAAPTTVTLNTGDGNPGNNFTAERQDIVVYRPDTPGDYSAGEYFMLLDSQVEDATKVLNVHGLTLVEVDTTVGGKTLTAGTIVVAHANPNHQDIATLNITGTGANSAADLIENFLTGADLGNSGDQIQGLHLLQQDTDFGATTLTAGTLLVQVKATGTYAGQAHEAFDIIALTVTQTEQDSVPGTAATGSLFFDGSDISLQDAANEPLNALTIISSFFSGANVDPVITSSNTVNTAENQTTVLTVTSTDADVPAQIVTYTISGGADAAAFSLNANSGVLTFTAAPDFETPTDVDTNNVYEVQVTANDGNGGTDAQLISVTVTDVGEGNILVVDTTSDVSDGDTSSIGALLASRGVDGKISLREAIEATNNTANGASPDEIHFNIADNDLGHFYYQDDLVASSLSTVTTTTVSDAMIGDFDPDYPFAQYSWFRIDLNNASPQLEITDALIINGYTQAGATQNSRAIGNDATLRIELTSSGVDGNRGLTVQPGGAGSSIFGLVVNGFDASGILVEPGGDNVTVQGNFIGTDVTGTIDLGNGDAGVHLRSSGNLVGGPSVADRNLISGNDSRGVTLFTFGPIASGNVIENNYIGVDATGVGILGNSTAGVQIYNNDGLQLSDNVIAANAGYGVWLRNSTSIVNSVITGNLIGVGADRVTAIGNADAGIYVDEAAVNTQIGGLMPGQANIIAHNTGDGIWIANGTGTSVRGNAIFANTGLGIDLVGSNGVDTNDAGDSDGGPNNLQNFPVLATATISGSDLTVTATLNSTAITTYDIDFYASVAADGSGYGEAERYLGSATVVTDGSGNVTINKLLTGAGVVAGEFVTATATDPAGNTSEFSLNVVAVVGNTAPTITSNGGGATAAVNTNENSTAVTTVTATDPEAPPQILTYMISGGADLGAFSLNAASGVLTFTSAPDFEAPTDADTDNVYQVEVTVDDGNGGSDVQLISVTVTDVNDAPVITSSVASNVAENQTAVQSVTASDEDLPGQSLTYTISGGADSGAFSLNATSGVLTFTSAPDFEAPTDADTDNVYEVEVTVDDGNGGSDVQSISVTVTDVNDAPVITSGAVSNVAENQTAVQTVTVSDEDLPGQSLTYTMTGGADSGAFSLNAASGVLTFISAPDFEAPTDVGTDNVYQVEVTVNDGNGGSDVQLISVTVTDVNDAPVITSNAVSNVAENQTAVLTVTASDEDFPGQSLTYTISGGADSGAFSLNATSGVLTFSVPPDFESPTDVGTDNVYQVEVTVDDGNGGSDVQLISVTVTDVNDAPVITLTLAAANVAENQTAVQTVTASDEDLPGQSLTYTISGGADSGAFSLNATSGVLTFTSAPDFEAPTDVGTDNVYEVEITADDSNGGSDVQLISVTVMPINENSPMFTSGALPAINENVIVVQTLAATDADLPVQSISYYVSGGLDGALFTVNGSSELVFLAAPDFESPADADSDNVYEVQVTADDGNGGTTVQAISVTVNDLSGPLIVDTTADVVDGDTASVEALLAAKGADGKISLREAIIATNNSLGADTITLAAGTYTLGITGNDNTSLAGDLDITDDLTIDGANTATTIIDASGIDRVFDVFNAVVVSLDDLTITGGDIGNKWGGGMNINDGTVNLTRVVVSGNNGDTGAGLYNYQAVLNVIDSTIFGNAGKWGGGIYNEGGTTTLDRVTINANTASTDGGGIYNDGIGANLIGTNVTISGNTGTGNGGGVLNKRTMTLVNATVALNTAADGGGFFTANPGVTNLKNSIVAFNTGANLNTSGSITSLGNNIDSGNTLGLAQPGDQINIDPLLVALASNGGFTKTHALQANSAAINNGSAVGAPAVDQRGVARDVIPDIGAFELIGGNGPPVITSPSMPAVTENTTIVHTLTALDPESDPVTFTISSGNDATRFTVNGSNQLVFLAAPDFEVPNDADSDNVYEVEITADDGNGGTDVQGILVTVTGVNDNLPVFSSSSTPSLVENQTTVLTLAATDADLPGQLVGFSISGGLDAGRFTINGSNKLKFLAAPDFEAPTDADFDNVYEVEIMADDGNGGTALQAVVVTVTGVNDNLPVFTSSSTPSLAENQTTVLTLAATDADLPGQSVGFSISGGLDAARFTIDGSNQLVFLSAADFEAPTDADFDNVYEVEIMADDGNGGTALQSMMVTVTGVNDNLPVFTSSSTPSLSENQTTVLTLAATDADLPGQSVGFSISGGLDAARFTIDGSNQLVFLAAPDFEVPTDADFDNIYEVEIMADDGNGGTALQSIMVTVTGVNDNLPVFISSSTPSLAENQTTVLTLAATDVDLPGQSVGFSISGGLDAARFTIDGSNQLVFLAAPDFEAPTDANFDNVYEVDITGDDGNGGTALQSVMVTVTGVNDNLPVFTSSSTPSLTENQTTVLTLAATDADLPGQSVGFSISGGLDAARFTIDGSNQLVFLAAADFEVPTDANFDNVYEVDITADDGNGGTALQSVMVTVTNVNESPAILSPAASNIAENTTVVGTVTATDPDGDSLTFTISGGNDAGKLIVDAATGQLSFVAAPNFELPGDRNADNVYQVELTVDDGNGGTATQALAVTVTDANDAPVSGNATYTVNQNEALLVAANGVLAGDGDEDGDPLTTVLVAGPAAGVLTLNADGSFSLTAPSDFAGTLQFGYLAHDGVASGNVATVTIVVNVVAVPPPVEVPAAEEKQEEVAREEEAKPPLAPPPAVPAAPPAATQEPPAPAVQPTENAVQVAAIFEESETDLTGLEHVPYAYAGNETSFKTLTTTFRNAASQVTDSLGEGIAFVIDSSLWHDLDVLRDQVNNQNTATPIVAGTTAGVSSVVTAGYVLWTIRGGWLVSSLLAQMPAWQLVDPLLILDSLQDDDLLDDEQREEDQQVEEMFDESDVDARS